MALVEQSNRTVYFDENFRRVDFDKIKPLYVIENSDNYLPLFIWQTVAASLDTKTVQAIRCTSRSFYNVSFYMLPLTLRSVRFETDQSLLQFKLFISQLKEGEQTQVESLTLPSKHDNDLLYMHEFSRCFTAQELIDLARHAPDLVSITNVLQLEGSGWMSFHQAYKVCFSLIRNLDLTNAVPLIANHDRPGQFLFFEVTYYLQLFQHLESLNLSRSAIVSEHSFHSFKKENLAHLKHIDLSETSLDAVALQRFLIYAFDLVTLNLRRAGSEMSYYSERPAQAGIQGGFSGVCKDQFPKLIEVDLTGTNVSTKDVLLLLAAAPQLSILKLPQTAEMDQFLGKMSQEIYARFDKLYYDDVLITPKKLRAHQLYLNRRQDVNLRASL